MMKHLQTCGNAADSDPGVLPGLIDLAWGASGHDPVLTEQIVQSQSGSEHLALASLCEPRAARECAGAVWTCEKT